MHSTKLSFATIPWTPVSERNPFPISFAASIFFGTPHGYASRLRLERVCLLGVASVVVLPFFEMFVLYYQRW
jgi:hypothetical protein